VLDLAAGWTIYGDQDPSPGQAEYDSLPFVNLVLRRSPSLRKILAVPAFLCCAAGAGGRNPRSGSSVSPCAQVSLKAQYLSLVAPGSGPGFHFVLQNRTSEPIRLAMPVPSSAHWFALEAGRWLWRASNGSGGNLVDADNPGGRMFAYRSAPAADPAYLSDEAKGSHEWDESVAQNPVLGFKPSCQLCNHPDDRLYRVVFAYAYAPRDEESTTGVIHCGLRSNFVDVPPGSY
jgi:hypothetical protein